MSHSNKGLTVYFSQVIRISRGELILSGDYFDNQVTLLIITDELNTEWTEPNTMLHPFRFSCDQNGHC